MIINFFYDYDPFYEVIFFQILSLCGTILFGICMFFPGLHIYVKKTFFLSLQIFISISAIELGAFIFCKFQILEKILKIITKGMSDFEKAKAIHQARFPYNDFLFQKYDDLMEE